MISGFFMSSAVQADLSILSRHKNHKSCKESFVREDPIVGVFTLNVIALGVPGYANISFAPGGILNGMDSFDIGEMLPNIPNGLSVTTWTGTWKAIGCRTYKFFMTNVVFVKVDDACCPVVPFARLKLEGTVTLSKNGKDLTSNLMVSFWDIHDLTVNTINILPPTPFPMSGLRVGD